MNFSKGFINRIGSIGVTFVGHSKGGGEAIAAATYTQRPAITFNAANFDFESYGLIEEDRTKSIDNYYVEGEILSETIKKAKIGTSYILPTQYWKTRKILFFEYQEPDTFKNHSINAVQKALTKIIY